MSLPENYLASLSLLRLGVLRKSNLIIRLEVVGEVDDGPKRGLVILAEVRVFAERCNRSPKTAATVIYYYPDRSPAGVLRTASLTPAH